MSTHPAATLTREGEHLPSDDSCVLDIGGMTCAACVNRIEKTLSRLDGCPWRRSISQPRCESKSAHHASLLPDDFLRVPSGLHVPRTPSRLGNQLLVQSRPLGDHDDESRSPAVDLERRTASPSGIHFFGAQQVSAVAAVVATAILAALAVLQASVAAGAPLGRFVWGGQHRTLPPRLRIGSAVSVLLYIGFALILLSRAGLLPGGDAGFVMTATWVLFAYFALGIVGNLASRSTSEKWTMAPTSVVLSGAALIVALS